MSTIRSNGRGGLALAALLAVFVAGCDDGGSGGSGGTGANGGGGSGGSGATGGGGDGGSGAGDATCGGIAGLACDDSEYCDFADDAMCGAADQTGTCQPKPDACTEDCPGVCGCDGQFYCNACEAASLGIDVDPNGSCSLPGSTCGGLAGVQCGATEYCDFPDEAICGADDQTGTCQPRPEACTQDCPGVCGCDGQFHCNACIAAAAGVDVDPNGSCGEPGKVCGGLAGGSCAADEYCDFPDDAMCGAADQTGLCQPRPEICTDDCPGVCGCDGQFYCNACDAASMGIDVSAGGTCTM